MDEDALLRQLVADPDDVATHLVYSDLLQTRGDPRGELIALQHAGATEAAEALLREHAEHFYGSVAARPRVLTNVEWRLGFIRSCRFALERSLDSNLPPGDYRDGRELARLLDEFLGHPSSRLVHALSLGPLKTPYNDYADALRVIAQHATPTLRALRFGEDKRLLISNTLGDPTPLATVGASLRELVIRTGDEASASLDARWFPKLRELRFSVSTMTSEGVATLLSTPWPDVETLHLQGDFRDVAAEWAPLFAGHAFPAVRDLGLHTFGRQGFFAMIASSDLLARLETLDLSGSILEADGPPILLSHRERFAHLKRLDLTTFVEDPVMREALCGLCPDVRLL